MISISKEVMNKRIVEIRDEQRVIEAEKPFKFQFDSDWRYLEGMKEGLYWATKVSK